MNTRTLTRRGTAVIAIICIIALALTGTYAFQTMAQQGWGQAIARDQFPTGRLHIDQEVVGENFGEMNWYPGQTANKEVYVENFGDMTPIFTRVRLSEYMETGIGAELHPNDPNFADRDVQPLINGTDRLNTASWTTLIPNAATGSSSAKSRNRNHILCNLCRRSDGYTKQLGTCF